MAFRADLEFDDLKFRVIEFTYEFRTPTEAASGQVSGRMIGGMLTFEVEVSAVNNLWLYQTENREIATGKIMFRQTEADSPMRTITFRKGHVIHLTERYSATDTILAQRNLYLGTGTRLMSSEGRALLEITADTCGRHDTLGGACSRESNTMRYAHSKHDMHACRDSFLCGLAGWGHGFAKRDLACNINFFMNVPVTPEGGLSFADGISRPGAYVA